MNGMQDFSADDLLDQMEEMQNEIEQKNDLIEDQETQLFQLKKTDGEKDSEIQRLNAFITNLSKENEDALSKLKENRNKLEQDLKKERSRRQSLSETYQRVNSQYITLLQEHDRLQRRYKQDVSMAENRTKSAEYIMAQTQKDCNAANAALLQFRTGGIFLLGASVPCLLVPGGSFLRDCSHLGRLTVSAAYSAFLRIVSTIKKLSEPAMGWNHFAGYILRLLMALVPIAVFAAIVYLTTRFIVRYFSIAANRIPALAFLLTSALCAASWQAWSAADYYQGINTALALIIVQPVFWLLRLLLSPVVRRVLHRIRE